MPNFLTAALAYQEAGLSVIPLYGKKPALRQWQGFQKQRANAAQIQHWNNAGLLQNIGIVCGQVSGNLAVIDLDGELITHAFERKFPDLAQSYHVKTGSGKGKHIYLECTPVPPTTRALDIFPYVGNNIELRTNGAYVVAPPSIHPETGSPYRSVGRVILRVNDLHKVVQWIESLRPRPTLTATAPTIKNASAYGRRALNDECLKVRCATEGTRNNQLYRSALKLGTLAQRGHLTESEVESALLNAAAHLSSDDTETASLRTIRSGLNNARHNGTGGRRLGQA